MRNTLLKQPTQELRTGLTIHQVPQWCRFPYLMTHYRLGGTIITCLLSAFSWHCETINVWTMVIINGYSLSSFIHVLWKHAPMDLTHALPFITLWLSALVHMPFSIGYHLFMCMSSDVSNTWRTLDLLFIYISAILLTFSLCYFNMPAWATTTWTLTATVVAIAMYKTCVLKKGRSIDKSANAKFMSIIVSVYLSVMVRQSIIDMGEQKMWTTTASHTITVFVSLLLGAYIYAKCIPECWYPGTFDLVGRSHQLMHVLVFIAHIAENKFLYNCYLRYYNK